MEEDYKNLDAILTYLNREDIKGPVPRHVIEKELAISGDVALSYFCKLKYEKLIDCGKPIEKINILDKGISFIIDGGYAEKYDKKQLVKQGGKSVITTSKLTWINIGLTIIFSAIVTYLQFQTNKREIRKETRENLQSQKDSIRWQQKELKDSLFSNRVLHILEGMKDSSKR